MEESFLYNFPIKSCDGFECSYSLEFTLGSSPSTKGTCGSVLWYPKASSKWGEKVLSCTRTESSSSDLGAVCEQFLTLVILFASVYIPKATCEQKRLEIHLSAHLKQGFSCTFLLSSPHKILATVQVLLIWKGKMRVALHSKSLKTSWFSFCGLALFVQWVKSSGMLV